MIIELILSEFFFFGGGEIVELFEVFGLFI